MSAILSVKNLAVEFATYGGQVKAVRNVSFELNPGEVLAIVGESGCGKSVTFQTIMGLIPKPPGKIVGGQALFEGADLLTASERHMEQVRGRDISMIFQDPLSSLNPTMTVGDQIAEVLIKHRNMNDDEARQEVLKLMKLVQIPESESRVDDYPHQFSGGMRQRIMIAIALACRPKILIADEPTTALDVTIQGQIMELLRQLRQEINMAIVLITHDLGVVASLADRVAVMYAGEIVEMARVEDIFTRPHHPYTKGLQAAIPNPAKPDWSNLKTIPGSPPDLFAPPQGCGFAQRCPYAMKVCLALSPGSYPRSDYGFANCWLHDKRIPKDVSQLLGVKQSHEVHHGS